MVESLARESRCVLCKGSKMLCGKLYCPLLVKYYHKRRVEHLLKEEMYGSSPPAVFVGRYGYPKVQVGPLVPPVVEDTSIMDTPEFWIHKSIDDVVSFRSMLVRGKKTHSVYNLDSKYILELQEITLASRPIDMEVRFSKKPKASISLDSEVQPYGPSAPLREMHIPNVSADAKVERAYYDTDWKAADALYTLYRDGVLVSKLQRALSMGIFGEKKQRRLVPTRWSITAVDSTLSIRLLDKIKAYPLINEYRVYESHEFDNTFVVLMLPRGWRYELVEAWYPNTVWNPYGSEVFMLSDYEDYNGRSDYAQIGGCYYAARLAVSELLEGERRQAEVIVLREARPGYIMPLGVWHVRENVRNALRSFPARFDCLRDAVSYIQGMLRIPWQQWVRHSYLLRDAFYQKRLEDFA